MAAIAHEPVPQNPRDHPRSPTRTAASRRPQPLQVPTQPGPAKEPRRKHRGKPPGPPSPPGTTSSSTELSSSSSSSSSRESSPRVRDKAKQKASEPRGRPSPFASEIAKTKIPRALEKPPQLPTYTGKGDPDEHVDTFDLILDYRDASDNVRCKLFPLSLSKAALKWYRELSPGSIKSWTQFTQLFSARFTASRVKPKSADILQGVKQGDKETLREYLERYNQVADEVDNLSDDIRVMFMRHGLRKGTLFRQEVGINKPKTMEEFMRRAQAYIDYEEAEAVTAAEATSPKTKAKEGKKKKDSLKEFQGKHSEYTDLTVTREKILKECANTEFKDVRWPAPIPQRTHTNKGAYCRYHRSNGHDTEQCRTLKDDIEDLIRKGKLKQYVRDEKKRGRSPNKAVNEVSAFYSGSSGEDSPKPRKPKPTPTAMVITGGFSMEVRLTKRSIKRHWQEVFAVGAGISPERTRSCRPPLSFSDSDLFQGKANDEIPLIISVVMAGVDVRRILVDQGSSVDILFKELLPKLKISESDLLKHDGTDLVGFNGSRTTPMGYIRLQATFGDGKASKKVETNFLVLPCPSPYHGIIGRPTLGKLGAVASTVHLKMRFYSDSDEVVTVPADLDAAKRCQYICLKAERMAERKALAPSIAQ